MSYALSSPTVMRFEPLVCFLSMHLRSALPFSRTCVTMPPTARLFVLHERMAQVSELGLAPVRLAVELAKVGRALMRIVLA